MLHSFACSLKGGRYVEDLGRSELPKDANRAQPDRGTRVLDTTKGETKMPTYISLLKYAQQGIQNVKASPTLGIDEGYQYVIGQVSQ